MVEDSSQIDHIHTPSILCLVLKLGKTSKLVFLGLVPNTTEAFQIYYGRNLWDLKNIKIPYKISMLESEKSFLHLIQVCIFFYQF